MIKLLANKRLIAAVISLIFALLSIYGIEVPKEIETLTIQIFSSIGEVAYDNVSSIDSATTGTDLGEGE